MQYNLSFNFGLLALINLKYNLSKLAKEFVNNGFVIES